MTEAEFFDAMYASADGDDGAVPWQQAISRPLIAEWMEAAQLAAGTRAMVVAAGLGDDAAALARKGVDVTAFDFSPTAVEWAGRRHADLDVSWNQADLFELPDEWAEAFDLVVEVFTIQSTPPARQLEAADAVRRLVAPGGTLVAVLPIHHGDDDPTGPPWPLLPTTVDRLLAGSDAIDRRTEVLSETTTCVRVELRRPS